MSESELEARIVELESRAAFQDDLLGNLNRQVADLSHEVTRLRALCRELREGMDSVRVALAQDARSEPPPPHY
jgi:SlyX protein